MFPFAQPNRARKRSQSIGANHRIRPQPSLTPKPFEIKPLGANLRLLLKLIAEKAAGGLGHRYSP
jgi:hypothetical protein